MIAKQTIKEAILGLVKKTDAPSCVHEEILSNLLHLYQTVRRPIGQQDVRTAITKYIREKPYGEEEKKSKEASIIANKGLLTKIFYDLGKMRIPLEVGKMPLEVKNFENKLKSIFEETIQPQIPPGAYYLKHKETGETLRDKEGKILADPNLKSLANIAFIELDMNMDKLDEYEYQQEPKTSKKKTPPPESIKTKTTTKIMNSSDWIQINPKNILGFLKPLLKDKMVAFKKLARETENQTLVDALNLINSEEGQIEDNIKTFGAIFRQIIAEAKEYLDFVAATSRDRQLVKLINKLKEQSLEKGHLAGLSNAEKELYYAQKSHDIGKESTKPLPIPSRMPSFKIRIKGSLDAKKDDEGNDLIFPTTDDARNWIEKHPEEKYEIIHAQDGRKIYPSDYIYQIIDKKTQEPLVDNEGKPLTFKHSMTANYKKKRIELDRQERGSLDIQQIENPKSYRALTNTFKPLENGWTPEEIYEAMIPYMWKKADKYSRRPRRGETPLFPKEDIFAAGAIGFMQALKDDEGLSPFSAYAAKHISSSMMDHIQRGRIIRTPWREGLFGQKAIPAGYKVIYKKSEDEEPQEEWFPSRTVREKGSQKGEEYVKHDEGRMLAIKRKKELESEGIVAAITTERWDLSSLQSLIAKSIKTGEEESELGKTIKSTVVPPPPSTLGQKELLQRIMQKANLTPEEDETIKLAYGFDVPEAGLITKYGPETDPKGEEGQLGIEPPESEKDVKDKKKKLASYKGGFGKLQARGPQEIAQIIANKEGTNDPQSIETKRRQVTKDLNRALSKLRTAAGIPTEKSEEIEKQEEQRIAIKIIRHISKLPEQDIIPYLSQSSIKELFDQSPSIKKMILRALKGEIPELEKSLDQLKFTHGKAQREQVATNISTNIINNINKMKKENEIDLFLSRPEVKEALDNTIIMNNVKKFLEKEPITPIKQKMLDIINKGLGEEMPFLAAAAEVEKALPHWLKRRLSQKSKLEKPQPLKTPDKPVKWSDMLKKYGSAEVNRMLKLKYGQHVMPKEDISLKNWTPIINEIKHFYNAIQKMCKVVNVMIQEENNNDLLEIQNYFYSLMKVDNDINVAYECSD